MLKKIILLSSVSLLSACSTLSSDDDLSNAVENVSAKPTYLEVVGKNIKPDNVSENSGQVLESSMFITANFARPEQQAPTSKIQMILGYFETYQTYEYALVNGNKIALNPYKITSSTCTDFCKATQYFTFPVQNEDLLTAIDNQFVYELLPNAGAKKLKFSVPGEYIGALLNSYKANALTMNNLATAPITQKQSLPPQMIQGLFAKATTAEKEQFTDWAFANRKSITTELNAEGKILPMLEYWYEKANADQKAEVLTWMLTQ